MTDEKRISEDKNDPSDQRYFPRWTVKSKVLFRIGDRRKSHQAQTEDLSCSGASIWTEEIIDGRQPIDMTVYLTEGTKVKLQGKIIWYRRLNNKTKMGVSFYNTTADAADLILNHAFRVDPKGYQEHFFNGW